MARGALEGCGRRRRRRLLIPSLSSRDGLLARVTIPDRSHQTASNRQWHYDGGEIAREKTRLEDCGWETTSNAVSDFCHQPKKPRPLSQSVVCWPRFSPPFANTGCPPSLPPSRRLRAIPPSFFPLEKPHHPSPSYPCSSPRANRRSTAGRQAAITCIIISSTSARSGRTSSSDLLPTRHTLFDLQLAADGCHGS